MDAKQVIRLLGLEPHTSEGGFFREFYRSEEKVTAEALGERYPTARNLSTAIYYLLTPEEFSAMHRLRSDEVFHYYLGDPVTLLLLYPDGHGETKTLGQDITTGQLPQALVPRSTWQGLCLNPGGKFALLGTTVAPGFDQEDFELGKRENLSGQYPEFSLLIKKLTR
jgi:uncharacterized protein